MAIDKNSTGFTLLFVTIMVVVVGSILASLAFGLKPLQKGHEADKKRMDILGALGLGEDDVTRDNVNELFPKYVNEYYLLDYDGKISSEDEKEVFSVDIKKQHRNTELEEEDKKLI